MRKGEILNLLWENVDLEKRQITVTDTKNHEIRVVPINQILYNTLRRLESKEDYVFKKQNGNRYVSIDSGYRNALKRAGIEDFTFHDLRHTFASWLAMNGADLSAIGKLLGHKTAQMTLKYAHLSPSYLEIIVEKLTHNSHKEDVEENEEAVS